MSMSGWKTLLMKPRPRALGSPRPWLQERLVAGRALGVVVVLAMLASLTTANRSDADQGTNVKGPLDRATIYQVAISKSQPVRVHRFPTDNADLGTGAKKNKPKYRKIARDMQEEAPALLVEGVVDQLKAQGFSDVAEFSADEEVGDDCLIVEGEFTMLNPGSQGKRYMVGFGAGKSKICTTGRVVTPAGEVLADFDHCRSQAMGMFGGDSEAQMMKDSMKTGSRFAEFMLRWAAGDYTH